jgi:hypothetical protein
VSKYCQVCDDDRIYLDAVPMCPECGEILHPWEDRTHQPERTVTEIDVHVHILNRGQIGRAESDPLPWLVGALVILVLAAVLVRAPT